MQHRERYRETRVKALEELGRESNLRHEHQRTPAREQHLLDEAHVDLGFAAAGDAVQEEGAKPVEGRRDGRDSGGLLREEGRARCARHGRWRWRALELHLTTSDPAPRRERTCCLAPGA